MIYEDKIYGKIEISEPIILDLINSPTLQRLKGIDQAGYFEPQFPGTARNRFEHSLGVYILLKKYGAPIEEQIAGLIHDVSHTVFSHCADYALDEGSETKQDYQDNIFGDFVKKSDIPAIIGKYGFDLDYILNEENFPLKEKKLPDLCADRIDYSLRTAIVFKGMKYEEVKKLLDDLTTENQNWIFKNFASAKKYAELFKELNESYYAGLAAAVMLKTVGDYLRYGAKKGYIAEEDFHTTDKEILAKLAKHLGEDKKLKLLFDRMNMKIGFRNDSKDYTVHVFCKSRAVDPLCRRDGKIKRVSEIDSKWKETIEKESRPKEYFIKFLE